MGLDILRLQSFAATGVVAAKNFVLKSLSSICFSKNANSEYKNICIYKIGNIGDIFCAIPAMYEVRNRYPGSRITLLTSAGVNGGIGASQILQSENWIDEIICYKSSDFSSFKGLRRFIDRMKSRCFDVVIQLPAEKSTLKTQIRNIFFLKMCGIKSACGFIVSSTRLFPKAQEILKTCQVNEVHRCLSLLPWQVSGQVTYGFDSSRLDWNDSLLSILSSHNICVDRINNALIISCDAKAKTNIWSLENYAYVAERWAKTVGLVVFVGGQNAIRTSDLIISNCASSSNMVNICGETSLLDSLALFSKARLMLSAETGTVHMAAAVGLPMVIVSPSVYYSGKWRPESTSCMIFRCDLPCSPCLSKVCKKGTNECINAIKPEQVWSFIEEEYIYEY